MKSVIRYLTVISLLYLGHTAFGQSDKKTFVIAVCDAAIRENPKMIDSLKTIHSANKSDYSSSVLHLIAAFQGFFFKDLSLAKKHLIKADSLAKRLNTNNYIYNSKGEKEKLKSENLLMLKGVLQSFWATYFLRKNDFDKAIERLQKAKSIFATTPEDCYQNPNIWYASLIAADMARLMNEKGRFNEAIEYYAEAQSLNTEMYICSNVAPPVYLAKIASIYRYVNNFKEAFLYHYQDIRWSIETGDTARTISSYIEISKTFEKKGNLDSTLNYLKLALSLGYSLKQNPHPETFYALGRFYLLQNKIDLAISHLQNAITFSQPDDVTILVNAKIYLADAYCKSNKTKLAANLVSQVEKEWPLEDGLVLGFLESESIEIYYKTKSSILASNGKANEALYFLNKAKQIKDSLYEQEKRIISYTGQKLYTEIDSLRDKLAVEYDYYSENDQENTVQLSDQTLSQEETKNKINFPSLLFWAAIAIYLFSRRSNKISKKINDEENSNHEPFLSHENADEQTNSLLVIEEEPLVFNEKGHSLENYLENIEELPSFPKQEYQNSTENKGTDGFLDFSTSSPLDTYSFEDLENREITINHTAINLGKLLYFQKKHNDIVTFYFLDNDKVHSLRVPGVLRSYLEKISSPLFLQVHKSYVVNFKYVGQFEKDQVILQNGTKISIARRRYKEIKSMCQKLGLVAQIASSPLD